MRCNTFIEHKIFYDCKLCVEIYFFVCRALKPKGFSSMRRVFGEKGAKLG